MKKPKIKFGTSGWRGILAEDFTFEHVRIVSQAIADYIKSVHGEPSEVIVAYDTRFAGENFAKEVASVLVANSLKVLFTPRPTPTPVVSRGILSLKTAGAINLTASHNPPMYNGIKYSPDHGGPAPVSVTSKVEELINSLLDAYYSGSSGSVYVRGKFSRAVDSGDVVYRDLLPEYYEDIRSKINFEAIRKSGIKPAFDLRYATAIGFLDSIVKVEGINSIFLNDKYDPYFGGTSSDPSPENLKLLSEIVSRGEANIGLAVDGDADRFGVIAEDGNYVAPNYVLTMLLEYLIQKYGAEELKKMGACVVRTIATTRMLERIARENGIDVIEVPVGFKYIGEVVAKRPVVLGGEESGGLTFLNHLPEKDGIGADFLILEMRSQVGPLKDFLSSIFRKYGKLISERIDLHFDTFDERDAAYEKLSQIESIPGVKILSVEKKDGVKFDLEGGWALLRPSGTEPLIRFYVEAESEERFSEIEKSFRKFLGL